MGGCATRPRAVVHPSVVRFIPEESSISTDRKNLESYYLFWLDSTVRSPEFIETQDELRAIINYMKIFESNEECEKEFKKIKNGKIFLIVNCVQGLLLLPNIHDHQKLHSIYMYHNHDNVDMNQATNQYNKIRGIYDSLSTVKRYLEDDIKMHTDLDDPMIIDIATDNNNLEYRERFILFLKIVNVNAKDIYDSRIRRRLIETYKKYYENNDSEVSFIEEFSISYKPEKATLWYIRGSCLHRLLSRAFIEQDMNVLVDMYSFIVDINQNIKNQCINQSSTLRVYRGQFIPNETLSLLKNNINQIITMQCFFCAQTSRDEILNLLQSIEPIDKTTKRILFEIDALQDYIFVDNNQTSTSKTILFVLGAVFKIIDVTDTTVILSQCTTSLNGNYDLVNESPLIIRGILTYLQNGTIEAIEYFKKLLVDESETDLATKSSIYGQLGYLEKQLGNYNAATNMYEKAMHNGIMQFSVYLFYLDQAAQYYANVLNNWEKAKSLWIQKLNIQNTFLSEEDKIQTYENLARATFETKQYAKTVEYTLAAIENLPSDHPHISFLQQQLECAKKKLSEHTTH
ncbi:unnamed protein product [Rotaria sordida]|uniref:Uncharacterized protein n=1 Tax=Rotaria sordida TaxID=392033 RepID=A0A814F786_9BILA|nr:unnamed protein product [Rotaria sordida]